ncbi:winged helix-turn-helix transcriptional regulator [Leptospira adleri]|uniref:Transcriptional regulator n=1 Tax=Leptospira adleri TaxID=2023186 RepID=A0A2M9YUP1_9LEPT|nr:helix-turn-helix domain-containing protein [Leptospira adleri]PJZ55235.1 transcriptional regulator [Leptospira adleri]PJZ60278.1 transcriptional regulator [Leptospira adleri]TGM56617.1 transcriptional regulator [Leptospira adleri]
MKRKNLEEDECPIARSLSAIGEWWSLLILRDAFLGKRRFGEFEKSLGLAKNILTSRLQKLVSHGILEIVPASDGSAYQEYVLTQKGKDLFPILVALRQWGETYLFGSEGSDQILVDELHQKPVRRIEIKSRDGRTLKSKDVSLLFLDKKQRVKSGKKNENSVGVGSSSGFRKNRS